jgi:N utilization substance protein B
VSKEARVAALELLYAADVRGEVPNLEGAGGRARRMAEGVWHHLSELDEELSTASRGWRVERMPAVDRSVLRLALYELRHTDTPLAVVIDEAVELAKRYSTARSGSFVNGVLGKLAEVGE